MTQTFADALAEIPAKHRAWLELDAATDDNAFPLFCYHGLGVLLNDAQEAAARDIFRVYPEGSLHVWRWANRTGKTTALDLMHVYAIWRKWRYFNADFDDWLAYRYQTLHAAPLNRLMGKAFSIVEAILAGRADQQLNKITGRIRHGVLLPFFEAGKSQARDGSDELWVRCVNGAKMDFLSTAGGAGRLESDAWWLISWDEFPRQQPVSDVIPLIDQTFLPRSSDYMAPIIFSGTATEDAEPVYAEIEEMAEGSPKDWNFLTFARGSNFSQSRESIDRQVRMSFDKEAAGRSVEGLSGQAGYGLFPQFAVDRAFTEELPQTTLPSDMTGFDPATGQVAGIRFFGAVDHGARHDENTMHTWACPFPYDRDKLTVNPIKGVEEINLRSSRTLVMPEIIAFVQRSYAVYKHSAIVVDATSEGGLLVYRELRRLGLPVVPCSYNAKRNPSMPPNKDLALQLYQRLLAHGLAVGIDEDGWAKAWPVTDKPFGGLRLPSAWRRTKRQLMTYKRYDEHITQDRAMCEAMLAWHVWPLYDAGQRARPMKFNVMARRTRTLAIGGRR